MLTAAYIRETILLMRKWDPEYAAAALERVKRNLPWLMKEPQTNGQPGREGEEG